MRRDRFLGAATGGESVYFPSKRDRWLGALLALPLVAEVLVLLVAFDPGLLVESVAVVLAAGAVPAVLVPWIWFGTGYRIAEDHLAIRSGPFAWRIPLASIKEVRPSRSIVAGPALSFDRLEIVYGSHQSVLVSPAGRAGFLEALGRRCPAARVWEEGGGARERGRP